MTRRSKRELERALGDLDTDDEDEIILRDAVVGTDWEHDDPDGCEYSDLDVGERTEETQVIEL